MKIPKIAFVGGIATEKLRNCLIQFNSCSRAWDKKWNEKRNQICNRFFSRVPCSFAEQLVANIENYYFATSRNARTAAGRVLLHFLFLINSHSKLGATNFIFTISDSVSRIHQMRAIFFVFAVTMLFSPSIFRWPLFICCSFMCRRWRGCVL